MGNQVVRVQGKGQVTSPLEIRRKLGLKKGDLVIFTETEQGVIIRPAEVIGKQAFDKIDKLLKEKGLSLEKVVGRGRPIPGEAIEKDLGVVA